MSISPEQVAAWNKDLRNRSPHEVIEWAVAQAKGRAIVSTNFRPYEAVVLHAATRVQPEADCSPCIAFPLPVLAWFAREARPAR